MLRLHPRSHSTQVTLNNLRLILIQHLPHLHLTPTAVVEEGQVLLEDHLIITVAVVAVDITITTVAIIVHPLQPCHLLDREYHGLQIKKKRFVIL